MPALPSIFPPFAFAMLLSCLSDVALSHMFDAAKLTSASKSIGESNSGLEIGLGIHPEAPFEGTCGPTLAVADLTAYSKSVARYFPLKLKPFSKLDAPMLLLVLP